MADCFLTDSKCRTVKLKSQDKFSTHFKRVLTICQKPSIYQCFRNSKILIKHMVILRITPPENTLHTHQKSYPWSPVRP